MFLKIRFWLKGTFEILQGIRPFTNLYIIRSGSGLSSILLTQNFLLVFYFVESQAVLIPNDDFLHNKCIFTEYNYHPLCWCHVHAFLFYYILVYKTILAFIIYLLKIFLIKLECCDYIFLNAQKLPPNTKNQPPQKY